MRILVVDTYYPGFLKAFYSNNVDASSRSYADQHSALMDCCFGTSNYYSKHLNALGHDAELDLRQTDLGVRRGRDQSLVHREHFTR